MKIIITIFLIMLILPIINAVPVYQKGTIVDLKIPCSNNGTYCSPSTDCNATIISPAGVLLKNAFNMTRDTSIFNVTLNETETNTNGEYELTVCCIDGSATNCNTLTFLITPNGIENTQETAIFYIGGLAIVLTLIGFVLYGWGISKTLHIKFMMFCCFWLLLIMLFYLSWTGSTNYLASLVGISLFFKWCFYISIFAVLPIVLGTFGYLVYMAITIPEIQSMMNHGVSDDMIQRRTRGRK